MNYQEWERSVPTAIAGDSLWKMEVYRLSLFAGDLAWEDSTKLMRDRRTRGLADQLSRRRVHQHQYRRRVLSEHRQGSSTFLQLCPWLSTRSTGLVLQSQARARRIGGQPPTGVDDTNHSNVTGNDSRATRRNSQGTASGVWEFSINKRLT
jgi:hypothetical protein